MFDKLFNFVTKKKESGQVVVEQISLRDAVFDEEDLFAKAVKDAAIKDLTNQINMRLLGIIYGYEKVLEANKLITLLNTSKMTRDVFWEEFKKLEVSAGLIGGRDSYIYLNRGYTDLAKAIAKEIMAKYDEVS